MENNILVLYIGVGGIRSEDIEDFTKKVSKKIIPSTFVGEVIVVPTHSSDTRIECINPQYISDDDIIHQHRELMEEINSELIYQLELMRINNIKKAEEIILKNKKKENGKN